MRARTIKRQVWLNENEYEMLKNKCKKANLTQSEFFRKVIKNEVIKEKPDDEFYQVTRDLHGIAININQIARQLNSDGRFNTKAFTSYTREILDIIEALKQFYILPTKKEMEVKDYGNYTN